MAESAQSRIDALQETNRRLEQGKEDMTRKNQELRQQITNLEEEVAHVKSRAREDKIFMEAKIEEVEELKVAADERNVKKEEIFREKIETLKSRKKGEKSRSVDVRIVNLESTLAEVEEEKGALQLKLVELEDIAGNSLYYSFK